MAKSLGFTGKAALHPENITTLNTIFSPSAQEIAHAEKVVALFNDSPNGLAVLDGKLIEKPVVRSSERILAIRDMQTLHFSKSNE